MNKQGVSLIEILVSCVIIALLLGGLSSIFVAGSRWITSIHAQSAGEEVGKLFLDPMQMHVRQIDWDNTATNALALKAGETKRTTYCDSDGTPPQNPLCAAVVTNERRQVGKIEYKVRYDVQDFNNVRKVKATISRKEPEML